MSDDLARLVEQARDLAFALATIDRRYDDCETVAGLADAAEQLQRDARTNDAVCHDLIAKAADFLAERDEARARVADLEAELGECYLKIGELGELLDSEGGDAP